jgi:hypothetical protein
MAEETHYAKCRRLKRCISCPEPATEHARCADCQRKRKEARAALAKARKCVDCKEPHEESGIRCAGCKAEHVRLYNERKAAGVCPHDGKPSVGKPGTPCANCLDNNRRKDRKKYAKLRREVVDHYSGGTRKCICCGEAEIEFLQVDHIEHRGGAKHRKEIGNGGTNLYTWIRKHKFPPGFQVLCANCNHAKGRLGTCPHEAARRQDRRVLDTCGPVCVGCGEDCSEILQVERIGGGYRVLCPTCNVKAARGIALPREKLAAAQADFYRENADDPYFEG